VLAQATPDGGSNIIEALLRGDFGPAQIQLKELPTDFKAIEVSLTGFAGLQDLEMGSAGYLDSNTTGLSATDRIHIAQLLTCYWTNGKSIRRNGIEYIAAYRAVLPNAGLGLHASIMSTGAVLPAIVLEPKMQLRLINITDIVSVSPRPDLIEKELVDFLEAKQAANAGKSGLVNVAIENMKQVMIAIIMYTTDNDDVFPDGHSIGQAEKSVMPYIKSTKAFQTQNPNGGQVLFNVNLAWVPLASLGNLTTVPVFYDSAPWPDGGRAVGFADGHAAYVTADNWNKIQLALDKKYKRAPKRPAVNQFMIQMN
jgi:hypothetical protein